MYQFWQHIRHTFITMCTRKQFTWNVKGLARLQAFIYYNVHQNGLHLANQCFGKTLGMHLLPSAPEQIALDKSMFWQNLRHSSFTMCTSFGNTSGIHYNVHQNGLHLANQCFGKTLGMHLLPSAPEQIALDKSMFWQNLRHSSLTLCTRMDCTWQTNVLAKP